MYKRHKNKYMYLHMYDIYYSKQFREHINNALYGESKEKTVYCSTG